MRGREREKEEEEEEERAVSTLRHRGHGAAHKTSTRLRQRDAPPSVEELRGEMRRRQLPRAGLAEHRIRENAVVLRGLLFRRRDQAKAEKVAVAAPRMAT